MLRQVLVHKTSYIAMILSFRHSGRTKHCRPRSDCIIWPFLPGHQEKGHIHTYANSTDPDQMLHNGAPDQGLHCLLYTGVSIKI